ncbi:MAG: non-canonical purine NTP pyrophosphatase [Bifidobacteriaceae bacterium]|jgi:XTP/dITP diphosphohydrolase|nr:non-canonical purine NTP pyrophosphatase [Bifidobacteriaceae bacterium]
MSKIPKLVLATHNIHKLKEFKSIIKRLLLKRDSGVDLSILDFIATASDYKIKSMPETALSFEVNSYQKAYQVCQIANLPTIADDSGLVVNILGAAPGILSARWAGKHGDDKANIDLLLSQLQDIGFEGRQAYFVCYMTLIESFENTHSNTVKAEGRCLGYINDKPTGENGFGYDPIFMPEAYFGNYLGTPTGGRSLAQLPNSFKNIHSHRAKAIEQLFDRIYKILSN